jgi:hypothetical protein
MPTHNSSARAKDKLLAFAIRTSRILGVKLYTAMNALRGIPLTLGFVLVDFESPHKLIGILP